jgi:hypothetical protein
MYHQLCPTTARGRFVYCGTVTERGVAVDNK